MLRPVIVYFHEFDYKYFARPENNKDQQDEHNTKTAFKNKTKQEIGTTYDLYIVSRISS